MVRPGGAKYPIAFLGILLHVRPRLCPSATLGHFFYRRPVHGPGLDSSRGPCQTRADLRLPLHALAQAQPGQAMVAEVALAVRLLHLDHFSANSRP